MRRPTSILLPFLATCCLGLPANATWRFNFSLATGEKVEMSCAELLEKISAEKIEWLLQHQSSSKIYADLDLYRVKPEEQKALTARAHSPYFKAALLALNATPDTQTAQEILSLLRAGLSAELESNAPETPAVYPLRLLGQFGTLEDLPLLGKIRAKFGPLTQHLIQRMEEQIQAAHSEHTPTSNFTSLERSPVLRSFRLETTEQKGKTLELGHRYLLESEIKWMILSILQSNANVALEAIANIFKNGGDLSIEGDLRESVLAAARTACTNYLASQRIVLLPPLPSTLHAVKTPESLFQDLGLKTPENLELDANVISQLANMTKQGSYPPHFSDLPKNGRTLDVIDRGGKRSTVIELIIPERVLSARGQVLDYSPTLLNALAVLFTYGEERDQKRLWSLLDLLPSYLPYFRILDISRKSRHLEDILENPEQK